ncbi:MAG: hypothetical protein RJA61_183 [Candidatus Parcubacteria bacterium]|jgi:hypothetical protein
MYKKLPVRKLTGFEIFKNSGPQSFNVLEFWQYGFSSLNSNVLRGALAEFIVENALKQNKDIDVRSPWGDYDVLYQDIKIEVKCCSYIQDWDQNQFSKVLWSGLKAKELYYSEAVTKLSDLSKTSSYKSDIYVLALFKHQDHASLDILDMNQWCFYVLSKSEIERITKSGNSVSLTRLEKEGLNEVSFAELKPTIKAIVKNLC